MEQIKKNFGCMRLPMNGENVRHGGDLPHGRRVFWTRAFNYFDTARGYLQGKSELALCKCLTSRYPRERIS